MLSKPEELEIEGACTEMDARSASRPTMQYAAFILLLHLFAMSKDDSVARWPATSKPLL
jgi:hypothetical protein